MDIRPSISRSGTSCALRSARTMHLRPRHQLQAGQLLRLLLAGALNPQTLGVAMGPAVKVKTVLAVPVSPPTHVLAMGAAPNLDIAWEEPTSKYDPAGHIGNSSLIFDQCCTFPAIAPSGGGSCKVKSGLTGECMSTSACSRNGGQSEAGHCPGDEDIQCCTHPAKPPNDGGQKSSDDGSCKISNGTLGTCISTTDCSSNGGISEAGHCPGATNIQVSCSVYLHAHPS